MVDAHGDFGGDPLKQPGHYDLPAPGLPDVGEDDPVRGAELHHRVRALGELFRGVFKITLLIQSRAPF